MTVSHDVILCELRAALGKPVELDPDVPLIESDVKVNSLTMLTVLARLEKLARIEIPQQELMKLSACSVNEIAAWFHRNTGDLRHSSRS